MPKEVQPIFFGKNEEQGSDRTPQEMRIRKVIDQKIKDQGKEYLFNPKIYHRQVLEEILLQFIGDSDNPDSEERINTALGCLDKSIKVSDTSSEAVVGVAEKLAKMGGDSSFMLQQVFSRKRTEEGNFSLSDDLATMIDIAPTLWKFYGNLSSEEKFSLGLAEISLKEAFGMLYERFNDRIYRYLYFRVGKEAEDLTSLVFTKALANLASFSAGSGGSFNSWLFSIARNTSIDFLRNRKKNVGLEPSETINPVEEILIEEKNQEVIRALQELGKTKPIRAEVIRFRFYTGLSAKEIGKIIGKSEENIRVIQHRALKNLKKIFKKRALGEE